MSLIARRGSDIVTTRADPTHETSPSTNPQRVAFIPSGGGHGRFAQTSDRFGGG